MLDSANRENLSLWTDLSHSSLIEIASDEKQVSDRNPCGINVLDVRRYCEHYNIEIMKVKDEVDCKI